MATTTKLTYDDYAALPDDGNRYEIIDGELFLVPAPNRSHQEISINLLMLIGPYVRAKKLGTVYHAPFDVVLSKTNVVQPDIMFVSAARDEVITDANIQGAPDLVIEILSPSHRSRDEVTKRRLYTQFEVAEFWIVDPARETVKVFRDGEVVAELHAKKNDRLTTSLLPGLEIPLGDVFA
jgi:Uma2 family endonuclease